MCDVEHYWPCCERAAIIIYSRNMVTHHCYEGTRDVWEAEHAKGYFRLTDSVLIIGAQ